MRFFQNFQDFKSTVCRRGMIRQKYPGVNRVNCLSCTKSVDSFNVVFDVMYVTLIPLFKIEFSNLRKVLAGKETCLERGSQVRALIVADGNTLHHFCLLK